MLGFLGNIKFLKPDCLWGLKPILLKSNQNISKTINVYNYLSILAGPAPSSPMPWRAPDRRACPAAALCHVCRASDVALLNLGSRCALLYNCSGHGSCTDEGRCACTGNWSGPDCADGVHQLGRAAGSATFDVRPDSWQYHVWSGQTPLSGVLLSSNESVKTARSLD